MAFNGVTATLIHGFAGRIEQQKECQKTSLPFKSPCVMSICSFLGVLYPSSCATKVIKTHSVES